MALDRDFVVRTLQGIVEDEEEAILRELNEVVSKGLLLGHTISGSSRLTLERHRVTKEGVQRAASKMVDQVRAIAGQDAPSLAEEADISIHNLIDRLLSTYRAGLGPTQEELATELHRVRERVVDDLRHRPISPSDAHVPLVGGDLNISAGGSVAVAGGSVVQHVEGIDLAALVAVLLQVRQAIDAGLNTP
jgi:hypothetical protein